MHADTSPVGVGGCASEPSATTYVVCTSFPLFCALLSAHASPYPVPLLCTPTFIGTTTVHAALLRQEDEFTQARQTLAETTDMVSHKPANHVGWVGVPQHTHTRQCLAHWCLLVHGRRAATKKQHQKQRDRADRLQRELSALHEAHAARGKEIAALQDSSKGLQQVSVVWSQRVSPFLV